MSHNILFIPSLGRTDSYYSLSPWT